MALHSLADVSDGAHVLIDANIFVYHFSAPPVFSDAPSQFLERVETGQIRGTTSTPVLIETLHRLMILEAIGTLGVQPRDVVRYLKESPTPIASTAVSSWSPAPSPTARPRPISPSSISSKRTSTSRGGDETRTIREKVTGKVLSLDRVLEPSLSALLSLLEVPVEDEVWGRLDPAQRRQRTLDAVKRLLLRESQVQPLLLLVEDLHWIDAETQALLDSLVESLPTARLLLLANYRPEYRHLWGSKTYYRQLRIDPLPAESADDLLTSLLGTDTSLDSLKHTLIARTEGNPLFLEESVRTLLESEALLGERWAYRLAHDATAIQVPATVQAILAARIDRLLPEDKRLLQAAAVIGKDVPFALLLAIAELGEEDLRRGLAHLQAAEFLYETSLFPDLEYTFKHALTHEVTYGGLLQERRRDLHARIVDVIETLH